MAVAPVFLALLEPLVARSRFDPRELVLGVGAILLTVLAPLLPHEGPAFLLPDLHDALLLLALALGCTLLPYSLALKALRQLSAYSIQLATNLEPVYAIVLAIPLLGEQRELAPSFYAGVAIILLSVLVNPLLVRRRAPVQHGEVLGTAESKGLAE